MISTTRKLLVLLMLVCSLGQAADFPPIYKDDYLEYWRNRYQPSLQWNFENLVIGSLTTEEKRQLGPVKLSLPLRAAGELASDPLVFYAADRKIVFPIQSVKFFDDLSLAWAYAWANNRSLENVTDYVAMLKYRKPPAGGFPEPLTALGVAPDAWKQDPKVDDVSQKILKSAMVWIMAHEVAHILYRHPGYGGGVSAKQAQGNEAQADQFANEIMRRIGVAPGGMANFFMMMAHWSPNRGDFSSDKSWSRYLSHKATHPFTGQRMQLMADYLGRHAGDYSAEEPDKARAAKNVRYIASQLELIASILNDSDIQRSIAAKARANDPSGLSYDPEQHTSKQQMNSSTAFQGNYRGSFIHFVGNEQETLSLELQLKRRNQQVSGSFNFGLGQGSLDGVVVGKQLRFQWVWGDAFGRGLLDSEPQGLKGTIGYDQNNSNAGR
ncbi:MAG: phage exclusion protein Lit family protein [Motiliproteus sp.]|nr:phage exclusion protein Lit family protein [Motiliproteus sp.]